jgi:hypothetical protein
VLRVPVNYVSPVFRGRGIKGDLEKQQHRDSVTGWKVAGLP